MAERADDEHAATGADFAALAVARKKDPARSRRLSFAWIVSPIVVGAGLTAVAALGHKVWEWADFWTGGLVNFSAAISLVSVFFLLERRFERIVDVEARRARLGLSIDFGLRRRSRQQFDRLLISAAPRVAEAIGSEDFKLSVYELRHPIRRGFKATLDLVREWRPERPIDLEIESVQSELFRAAKDPVRIELDVSDRLAAKPYDSDLPKTIIGFPLYGRGLARSRGVLSFASRERVDDPRRELLISTLTDIARVAEAIL